VRFGILQTFVVANHPDAAVLKRLEVQQFQDTKKEALREENSCRPVLFKGRGDDDGGRSQQQPGGQRRGELVE
jgi:hypothetical protein